MAIASFAIVYSWAIYNLPIFLIGLKNMRKLSHGNGRVKSRRAKMGLSTVSIIVAVKDEEKVVTRLLDRLLGLDYPSSKKEILVVEDGSSDKTAAICETYASQYPGQVRFFHRSESNGKPSALNFAFQHATGEIIAIFDADSVPASDVLMRVAGYFEDPSIVAVQGRTLSINADENVLTKIVSYEEITRFEVYLSGKDQLGLYLPFTGSCQFVRKQVLKEVGGWNEDSLAEDVEMSVNLLEKGYRVKYAPDIQAWQENPRGIAQVAKQRLRWHKGWIEVAAKYGRLILRPSKVKLDAEITLVTPFILPTCLLLYILAILTVMIPFPPFWAALVQALTLFNVGILFVMGLGLFLVSERKASVFSWIFWTYAYWILHVFIATYALLEFILMRHRCWNKTAKTGAVSNESISWR